MTTLADLKAKHPEWCFGCGACQPGPDPFPSHPCGEYGWKPGPVLTSLIAKAHEDEAELAAKDATIAELKEKLRVQLEVNNSLLENAKRTADAQKYAIATERTAREEADAKLIRFWDALTTDQDFYSDPSDNAIYQAALARQAARNTKETK